MSREICYIFGIRKPKYLETKFLFRLNCVVFFSSTLGKKYETVTVVSAYKVYMKLHIRNVKEIDFMQYKCVAKNALGYSDGSITLYGMCYVVQVG